MYICTVCVLFYVCDVLQVQMAANSPQNLDESLDKIRASPSCTYVLYIIISYLLLLLRKSNPSYSI